MHRPRIILVLLVKGGALVKSKKFKDFTYVGDPINAIRIFSKFQVDELILLDIEASKNKSLISLELLKQVSEEASMPFAVGGGISNIQNIRDILSLGAEKVVVNTYAALNPKFIEEASKAFGSSTISVCIDVKNKWHGAETTWIYSGSRPTKYKPLEFAKMMEQNGAGEIIIQSMRKDGTMEGYDIELVKKISDAVKIPVVALGGAGKISDFRKAYYDGHANGLAAGSIFVFYDSMRGILINYPERKMLKDFLL